MLDYGFFYDVARFLNEHCKGNYTEKEVACNAYEYMKNYEAFVYSEGKYGSEIKIIMKMLKKMNTDDANSYLYKIETSLQKGKGDYMKMYVPFCYEKMGRIEVEANSVREAQEKAQDILDEMLWKDCGRLAECVDDSAQIDYDGIILDENQNIVEAE